MIDNDERTKNLHQNLERIWANLPGWGTLAAVNHTSVGKRFLVTGTVFFLIGGLMAMLIRTQLALPQQSIVPANVYNQLFTMHGTVMMFLFAIPVLEGLAIYLIPKMIGARDLVFPRLSSFGYYCYLFGGIIVLSSLFLGIAPDSGWFMYTPLSSSVYSPGAGSDFWLIGITFVEISAVSAGVELAVSILRSRTNGMSLRRMPLFCWYILATALMIVFGFPPLILASILLELERAAGLPFFEVAAGGDPLLWQHLFWLFGHPEVYIIFLPAAGIVSTLIPVFAGRPIVGYRWVVLSVLLTAFISFGLWVHHMFTVGIPQLALTFFSAASMLVAIPTGIQIFVWLATLWSGKVVFKLPMLWIYGFLFIFIAGGLTGVMLALVPFNWQVHDTHFVVAHMHYVLVGGMLFPLIAGAYYWLPNFSGRMPSGRLSHWGFWLTFIGFNTTFLLMHVTGLLGMPRRVYTYEAGLGWDWLNLLSSVGGFIFAAGAAAVVMDLALHFRFGRLAPRNPWHADSLEWLTAMPPSPYNIASLPDVHSRHPLWHQPELLDTVPAGQHGLADTRHQLRETYGSDATSGLVRETFHLPSNSWLPMQAAFGLAVLSIALIAKSYWIALVAALVAIYLLLLWGWRNGGHPSAAPLQPDERLQPPLHSRGFDGPGLWGMVVTLMADGTLYVSLLFGWFYLWTVAPYWQLPEQRPISLTWLLISGVLLTIAVWVFRSAVSRLRLRQPDAKLAARFWFTAVTGLLHLLALLWVLLGGSLQATELTHDAVLTVMLIYLLLHSGLAIVLTALQAWRVSLGYVSVQLPYEPVVLLPFWIYTVAVFWLSIAAFILLPLGWGGR